MCVKSPVVPLCQVSPINLPFPCSFYTCHIFLPHALNYFLFPPPPSTHIDLPLPFLHPTCTPIMSSLALFHLFCFFYPWCQHLTPHFYTLFNCLIMLQIPWIAHPIPLQLAVPTSHPPIFAF